MVYIEFKSVYKKFKTENVLEDINFEIESGEIFIKGNQPQNGMFPQNMRVLLDCTGFISNMSAFDNLKLIVNINSASTRICIVLINI